MKCQIVRISHATTLVPRGIFRVKEDEEREIEEEEAPATKPDIDFYWKMENWLHLSPGILRQGRTVREEAEFTEDFDDEDQQNKIRQKLVDMDPYAPRLTPVSADTRTLTRQVPGQLLEGRGNWRE